MTLVLREADVPLHNKHRRKSVGTSVLLIKRIVLPHTNGAAVGYRFISLIHTCLLYDVNSFDYLIELERHEESWRQILPLDALKVPRCREVYHAIGRFHVAVECPAFEE